MRKKITFATVALLCALAPALASAQSVTIADLQAQLATLLQQISQLQSQLGTAGFSGPAGLSTPANDAFTITASTSPALSITGISAPAQLQMQQVAHWSVFATAATGTDPLRYSVSWGDGTSQAATSATMFSHSYSTAGTFQPVFTVSDASSSDSITAAASVTVSDNETPPPAPSSCPSLTRTLSSSMTDGATGGQVSALQNFLIGSGDLAAGNASGFFGPLTLDAVTRFQMEHNISAVGFVGPQTRAAIASLCQIGAAVFAAAPMEGSAPLTVSFTANTGGVVYPGGYGISYGDGTSSALTSCGQTGTPNCPSHTYTQQGSYQAHLFGIGASSGNIDYGAVTITVSAPTTGGGACTVSLPTHDLSLGQSDGDVGGDVSLLQQFLVAQGSTIYPEQLVTGFFGTATQAALQRFQKANDVSPTSGFLGVLTRAAMHAVCSGNGPLSSPYSFKAIPASGAAPLSVSFTTMNAETRLSGLSYVVDFGDGTRGTMSSTTSGALAVSHSYARGGTFNAKLLQESNLCGASALTGCVADVQVDSATVTVSGPPAQTPATPTPAPAQTVRTQTFNVSNDCNGSFCSGDQQTADALCAMKGFGSSSSFQTYAISGPNPNGPVAVSGVPFYTGNESWWDGSSWQFKWGGQCDTGGICTPHNRNEISSVTCQSSARPAPSLPAATGLTAVCNTGSRANLAWKQDSSANEWKVEITTQDSYTDVACAQGTGSACTDVVSQTLNPAYTFSAQSTVTYDWTVTPENFAGAFGPATPGPEFMCYADTPNMDSGGS